MEKASAVPNVVTGKVDYFSKEYWHQQIALANQWKINCAQTDRWDRVKMYYECRYDKPMDPHFNLIYILGSSWVPVLVFQNPGMINTPRRPEFIFWASFFDAIDNWLVDEMEVQEILEEVVLNAFLYNTVGLELGYDFPESKIIASEMRFAPIPDCVDRTRKSNQPWIDMIQPQKLLLAPGTRTMRNCRWYAKNVCIPTDQLKTVKGLKNVSVTHIPEEVKGQESQEYSEAMAARGFTNFWIIHEAEKQQWFWLSSKGEFIRPPEDDPLQIDGLPLEVLSFNSSTHSLWGTSDAIYIETQQAEGDETRYDGRLQRKAALVKGFYDSDLLSEEQIIQFITNKSLGMIPVHIPNDKKLSEILTLVQPHVQGEYFQYEKEILNDAQLTSGTGPNQMGTFAPGRRTKYETQVVEERNFLRAGLRRGMIARKISMLFGRINQMIIKYWTAPLVQKVVGADAAMYYVQATPSEFKELRAQLTTRVNIDSLIPTSRQRKKEEMLELLAVLSKIQGINIIPIVQQFLTSFDFAEVARILPNAQMGPAPMSLDQFGAQQQQMVNSPNYPQVAGGNLQSLNPLINMLPPGGTGAKGNE